MLVTTDGAAVVAGVEAASLEVEVEVGLAAADDEDAAAELADKLEEIELRLGTSAERPSR